MVYTSQKKSLFYYKYEIMYFLYALLIKIRKEFIHTYTFF